MLAIVTLEQIILIYGINFDARLNMKRSENLTEVYY